MLIDDKEELNIIVDTPLKVGQILDVSDVGFAENAHAA